MSGVESHLALHARFAGSRRPDEPAWLPTLRKAALARFTELGFPTQRSESWRYTNVTRIAQTDFHLARDASRRPTRDELEALAFPVFACSLYVFVNGRFAPELSSPRSPAQGIRVESLADVLLRSPGCVEPHLARHADFEEQAFVALNSAFLDDGAFVQIPAHAEAAGPIHVVHLSIPGPEPLVSHPRTLIVVERGSRAAVLEDYVSLGTGTLFTNAVSEIVVGEGAHLEHVKLQREGDAVLHVGALHLRQDRDSRLVSHSISLGAALARHDIVAALDAEGADCTLNGLYAAADGQHVDHQTTLDHARPRGTSRELYKGVLAGSARGVFNGRVIVRADAQHTDSRQTNKNLLLSRDAEVNSKPQLEIAADDVKCSHGSSIGSLDEDALFYLRARGLAEPEARVLLTRAFASEVVNHIGILPLRPCIEELLVERLADALPQGAVA